MKTKNEVELSVGRISAVRMLMCRQRRAALNFFISSH